MTYYNLQSYANLENIASLANNVPDYFLYSYPAVFDYQSNMNYTY